MMDGRKVVCVTGASGMVGQQVVEALKSYDMTVRVLSRRPATDNLDVEHFVGDLSNHLVLREFLAGSQYLFHCAGEIRDETKMYDVNVRGTENIHRVASEAGIDFFCFISSAGVVGKTDQKWVTEQSACNPQNAYERSKHEAEQVVKKKIPDCTTVILRPINVIDDDRPGVFSLPIRNSAKDRLFALIKGAECAHIVHAQHVAECAVFFMGKRFEHPETFFVGIDDDGLNTYQGIYNTFVEMAGNRAQRLSWVLPSWVPYVMRKTTKGNGNKGDVKYSSEKLSAFGFQHEWTVTRIAKLMVKKYCG